MEQVQAEVEAELRSKAKSVNIIGFPTCWVKDGQRIFICLMEILLKKTQALYIFFWIQLDLLTKNTGCTRYINQLPILSSDLLAQRHEALGLDGMETWAG